MSGPAWKDALWNLLEALSLRRLGARIALSAGLLGLATHAAPESGTQPRVPIAPALVPEVTVRKFKGRYILKRAANSFFMHLAGHRSHSSHSSHRSHSSHSSHRSHSSSSHYSSSHFSSSPAPPPRSEPVTPAPPVPTPPVEVQKPKPSSLHETFKGVFDVPGRWTSGVLATPPDTFDGDVVLERSNDALSIRPIARKDGSHFGGYLSTAAFDLNVSTISAELRRAAAGATTLFTAAHDAKNWMGFRIENGRLSMESHTGGKAASHTVPYDPKLHRFLRLRITTVAPVVIWETSTDGREWNPEYVETPAIQLHGLRIALSAGTMKRADATGAAVFDNIVVEGRP